MAAAAARSLLSAEVAASASTAVARNQWRDDLKEAPVCMELSQETICVMESAGASVSEAADSGPVLSYAT